MVFSHGYQRSSGGDKPNQSPNFNFCPPVLFKALSNMFLYSRNFLFLLCIAVSLTLELPTKETEPRRKSESLTKLFSDGRSDSGSEELNSEEDYPQNKFVFNVKFFKGSISCGKLGRHILKDTKRLFGDAAAADVNPHRISHHLSHLYSRYADECCDYHE